MKKQIIAIALILVLNSLTVNASELVTLITRPGVEQKFIMIKPDKPIASVILFSGGKGVLNLSSFLGSPIINQSKKNFLVRTKDMFVKHGFLVAVVDAPSDQKSKTGMLFGFRASVNHVEDIDHVIRYLKKQANVPLWLIGTSRGTESATSIAINSKQHPDGLVLTSSMSVPNSKGTAVTEMDLKRIKIPTLVVANNDDECSETPPAGAEIIAHMLINSKKVEVKIFSGGDIPKSKPCWALSYHGFLGIEDSG